MSVIQFSSALPENTKDTYNPFDNVDFMVYPEGRSLMLNKLRLVGKLSVRDGLNRFTKIASRLKDVSIDGYVGAHSLISDIQVEFMGGNSSGIQEIINDYPRYVKMSKSASNNESSMCNASQSCELCSPFKEYSRAITCGSEAPAYVMPDATTEVDTLVPETDLDFSVKLNCCLNKASGNTSLDVSKTGAIKVSITLNRNQNVFNGQDVANDTVYTLHDLKLNYCSVDTVKSQLPTVMRTKYTYKTNISSGFSNIQTKVPAVCDGVSMTFQPSADEGNKSLNNTQLSLLPNVSEVVFTFNDSTNSLVSYSIKDDEELVERYLESLSKGGENNAKMSNILANEAYGIGLDFRDRINLSNQKLNTQITSDVNSSNPFVAYLYFHSMVSV